MRNKACYLLECFLAHRARCYYPIFVCLCYSWQSFK